jgi:hypothetical protein
MVAGAGGSGGSDAGTGGTSATGGSGGTGGTFVIDVDGGSQQPVCEVTTCAALGWACGYIVDECDNMINCADEGLSCGPLEACTGGVGAPTTCESSLGDSCSLCGAVKDCSTAAKRQPARQPATSSRVLSPSTQERRSSMPSVWAAWYMAPVLGSR